MKITLMVRVDLGHILWGGGVVRVERAHRVRLVRGVQNLLDLGRYGVIDFGHIRFVVRARAVPGVVREDELIGRCAYPRVRGTMGLGQGWLMVVVIGELEAIRLASVNLTMGRVSTIGSRAMVAAVISQLQLVSVKLRIGRVSSIGPRAMAAAVVSELEARHFVYVNRKIGRMRSIVVLRGRRRQVIGRGLRRVGLSDIGGVRTGAPRL